MQGAAPTRRNSYADVLRATAIGAVVVGHWLLTDVRYRHGRFDGVDAITYRSWAPWITLVLQVVPIFFLAGGYANAISWSRYAGSWEGWLRSRMRRLLGPTAAYIGVCVAAVAIAQIVGVAPHNVSQAAWALAFHLWFLAAYAVLLLMTPLLSEAHRRWGFAVPLVMSVLAIVISAGVVQWQWHLVGWANYVLVWGTFHQLGFAWYDGGFARRRWLAPVLAICSLTLLVALIWPGPYPVSMVGVPGASIQNPSPPSAALLAFGLTQSGFALAAEGRANRWLARRRFARALARQGAVLTMPVYLWHMVPVMAVALIASPTGLLPQSPPRSTLWLAQRALWIAVLASVLGGLIALLAIARRRWDRRRVVVRTDLAEPASPSLLLMGVIVTSTALARLAIKGFAPEGRTDVATLAVFAAGTALVMVHQRRDAAVRPLLRRRPARASARSS